MLDNQLYILLIALLKDAAPGVGLPANLQVMQAYQTLQQGAATAPAIYIHKIGDKRYGYPQRKEVWNPAHGTFDHREIQQYETTFQLAALAIQDPTSVTALTAPDMLNLAAHIMQSDATIATLEAAGVGIYRVQLIPNSFFMDDRERFEAAPSLEFTVTHKQDILSQTPVVTATEVQILNV